MRSLLRASVVAVLCVLSVACAPVQLFPPAVMEDVDKDFDFVAWKSIPNATVGRKVQLGGRIVQADLKGEEIIIVAVQLPIVEHPAYGPRDTRKRTGEFVISYKGTIEPSALAIGNRLVVVGVTEKAKTLTLDDIPRSLPAVAARCVHIWKTAGREISDFPHVGAGYEALEENTYCVTAR